MKITDIAKEVEKLKQSAYIENESLIITPTTEEAEVKQAVTGGYYIINVTGVSPDGVESRNIHLDKLLHTDVEQMRKNLREKLTNIIDARSE